MLKFKQIKGATLRAVAIAAALASTAVGASVVKNEALHEQTGARFTYAFVNTGPIEERRAEYVALRDQMADMLRQAREAAQSQHPRAAQRLLAKVRAEEAAKASPAYVALGQQLAAIPVEEKWQDGFTNLVTTVGGNSLLTEYFKGSSYTAAWYLGLVSDTGWSAFALADTASSHAGWTESTVYSNSTRIALSFGTAASKSLAASAAAFTINGTDDINGAFAITNSTKGGTTGILYSEGSFAAVRNVNNGDTLNVTLTVTC